MACTRVQTEGERERCFRDCHPAPPWAPETRVCDSGGGSVASDPLGRQVSGGWTRRDDGRGDGACSTKNRRVPRPRLCCAPAALAVQPGIRPVAGIWGLRGRFSRYSLGWSLRVSVALEGLGAGSASPLCGPLPWRPLRQCFCKSRARGAIADVRGRWK